MSTNALTNTTISTTYVGVLHSRGTQLPATGQRDIFDGVGQRSALKLGRGCNGATICGPLSASEIIADNIKVNGIDIINLIYPVGSIIFNTGTNPQTYIPNTSWIQTAQGRFVVGVGTGTDTNNISHTFTLGMQNEPGTYVNSFTVAIPSHRHGVGVFTSAGNDDAYFIYGDWNDGTTYNSRAIFGDFRESFTNITGSPFGIKTSLPVESTGDMSTTTVNNTPPSFGLFIWQRTQ
jgi:hypothetical protein